MSDLWRRLVPRLKIRQGAGPGAPSTPSSRTIDIADLDEAARTFLDPARHHELEDCVLRLPDWFVPNLAPDGVDYLDQQLKLWREITGRDRYDPASCEDSPDIAAMDFTRRPSFYATGSAAQAAPHVMAMGHILFHSDVRAGDRVLEYGAGFGRNALAFARLGAVVDTVDIAPGYCAAVSASASQYGVDLTAHHRTFGFNPAGRDAAYDLILFYESFHHALDFAALIPRLAAMLKPGGRIILAGEPIVRDDDPLPPYPWGIRLDWRNIAVMRLRGWMELGFREDFLMPLFARSGLGWTFHIDPRTDKANLYLLRKP